MTHEEGLTVLFLALKRLGIEIPPDQMPGLIRTALNSKEEWDRQFGTQGETDTRPGSFIRLRDHLLKEHGLPVPTTIVILAPVDSSRVLCAPMETADTWPDPFPNGVLWLRKKQSPFTRRVLIDLRLVAAFNIHSLVAHGRALAHVELPENQVYMNEEGLFDISDEDRERQAVWQRFADALAGTLPT